MAKKGARITRGNAYQATDGKWFYGKGALDRAKEYQKRVDFRNLRKKIAATARLFFKVTDEGDDGTDSEEEFCERLSDNIDWDVSTFDEFIDRFMDLFIMFPEHLEELVALLKKHQTTLKGNSS